MVSLCETNCMLLLLCEHVLRALRPSNVFSHLQQRKTLSAWTAGRLRFGIERYLASLYTALQYTALRVHGVLPEVVTPLAVG